MTFSAKICGSGPAPETVFVSWLKLVAAVRQSAKQKRLKARMRDCTHEGAGSLLAAGANSDVQWGENRCRTSVSAATTKTPSHRDGLQLHAKKQYGGSASPRAMLKHCARRAPLSAASPIYFNI